MSGGCGPSIITAAVARPLFPALLSSGIGDKLNALDSSLMTRAHMLPRSGLPAPGRPLRRSGRGRGSTAALFWRPPCQWRFGAHAAPYCPHAHGSAAYLALFRPLPPPRARTHRERRGRRHPQRHKPTPLRSALVCALFVPLSPTPPPSRPSEFSFRVCRVWPSSCPR